ncbi:MAG: PHP domain-containing protein, partial [Oscillospiraceae bacterium]|nr:PHP domain-containing protein [Oscillospiraceae bacterium]
MKYLLPNVPKFYKANLHTHTTCSDGVLTPEQVRDAYKEKGYSILAITDHSYIANHQHLNQEDFLMLTGVEVDLEELSDIKKWGHLKVSHFCLIS